ncbi:MAG: DUF86 domain-containing protein [Lachnospiraceae bacterium]|nr:DUF86 domain-containing protein [Lachnospiraceae bacterium]
MKNRTCQILVKLLPMDFRKEYPQVPWREWCGVRDIFAHQYEELKIDVAWDTIEHDVLLDELYGKGGSYAN